jgi:hypothetical protein
MSAERIETELRAANPVAKPALAALDLAAGEAALGQALLAEPALAAESQALVRAARRPRSPRLLVAGVMAVAAAAAVFLLAGGGASESPAPAYGAKLVRFAESTPLLLLDEPGWRVRGIQQQHGQGRMEFGIASPASPEAHIYKTHTKHGAALHRDGLRRVELFWYPRKLGNKWLKMYEGAPKGHGFTTSAPVLGTIAHVDPRAESSPIYGGPGHHQMLAAWRDDGRVLVLNASVPNLAVFRERLDWLRRVDTQTWLDAMPAKVVRAADYGAAVREMLQDIPLPPGFDPTRISDLHLTTDRYQVGAAVGGAVACEWFRYWGEARAGQDAAATQEAEHVLLESENQWPIFREMSKEGAYPATVVEYAEAMPSGRWYGRPLLSAVNSEGGLCGPRSAAAPAGSG